MSHLGEKIKRSSRENNYEYFSDDNALHRKWADGLYNEIDSAIVLLEVALAHPGFTVLPAPIQFESGRDARRNVDFLVIDTIKRDIVGVQVKSKIWEDSKEYDDGFVVMIDCSADFGNTNIVDVKSLPEGTHATYWEGSKYQRQVHWAGGIAAQAVRAIPTQGPNARMPNGKQIPAKFILQKKMQALKYLKNRPPTFGDAVVSLDHRIMEAMRNKPTPESVNEPRAASERMGHMASADIVIAS